MLFVSQKKKLGYPEKQRSLIIMDIFKGQDNDGMKQLTTKNKCELVVVLHNFTNKFQPLNIRVNRAVESKQLSNKIAPGYIKVSLRLNDLKPLHAKWIVDTYNHLWKETIP